MVPTWAAVRLVPTAVDLGDATGDNVSYLGGRSSGSDPRSSGSDPRPSGHGDRRPCVLLEQPFVSLRWQSIWPLRWPTWAAVRPAFTAVHVVVVVLLERLVVWLRPPFIWPRPQATMRPTWAAALTACILLCMHVWTVHAHVCNADAVVKKKQQDGFCGILYRRIYVVSDYLQV